MFELHDSLFIDRAAKRFEKLEAQIKNGSGRTCSGSLDNVNDQNKATI